MRRPARELPAPSLEGADERWCLVQWLEFRRDLGALVPYRDYRDHIERQRVGRLPARDPFPTLEPPR